MRCSQLAQGIGGFPPIGKEAKKVFRADEIGSLGADQSEPVIAWRPLHLLPGAQLRSAAQAAIVNRLSFLAQSRIQLQCTEFTDRLTPVNAAHLLAEAHLLVLSEVGREVRPYALTQVPVRCARFEWPGAPAESPW